jgi:hypothetical protein
MFGIVYSVWIVERNDYKRILLTERYASRVEAQGIADTIKKALPEHVFNSRVRVVYVG